MTLTWKVIIKRLTNPNKLGINSKGGWQGPLLGVAPQPTNNPLAKFPRPVTLAQRLKAGHTCTVMEREEKVTVNPKQI